MCLEYPEETVRAGDAVPDHGCGCGILSIAARLLGAREAVAYIYAHPDCQRPDPAFDAWCDRLTEAYGRLSAELPRFEM